VVIDAHRFPLRVALAGHPDVVKINREELIATVTDPLVNAFPAAAKPAGAGTNADGDTLSLAGTLIEWGARCVVVTDGSESVLLLEERKEAEFLSVPEVDVVNTVGSGDAMSGALSLALLRGWPLRDAVRFGIAAGAANAATLLPGDIDPATVEELFDAIP
jgi:fructose-1-phosphate kinase PfkB-like protein